jgi:very-short-patch-repair endonuclease
MPPKPRWNAPPEIIEAARHHRKEQTLAETMLWEALRASRLNGVKFRRQHPIDTFILDFFSPQYQLAIEIDGEIHQNPDQSGYDAARSEALELKGIRVLRFKNDEVVNHLDGVLEQIKKHTSPSGSLS